MTNYMENASLERRVNQIMADSSLNKREKCSQLEALKKEYQSSMSKNHIDYYLHSYKKNRTAIVKNMLVCFVCLAIVLFYATNFIKVYKQNQPIIEEATLKEAISSMEQQEYDLAEEQFKYLIDRGWRGYTCYAYLSECYVRQEKYAEAADILIYYLDNIYGIVNVERDNDAYKRLYDLAPYGIDRVSEFLEYLDLDLYDEIEDSLAQGAYEKALYDCKRLAGYGARSYSFACYYITALLENACYEEAYEYCVNYMSDTSNYQFRYGSKRVVLELIMNSDHYTEEQLTNLADLYTSWFDYRFSEIDYEDDMGFTDLNLFSLDADDTDPIDTLKSMYTYWSQGIFEPGNEELVDKVPSYLDFGHAGRYLAYSRLFQGHECLAYTYYGPDGESHSYYDLLYDQRSQQWYIQIDGQYRSLTAYRFPEDYERAQGTYRLDSDRDIIMEVAVDLIYPENSDTLVSMDINIKNNKSKEVLFTEESICELSRIPLDNDKVKGYVVWTDPLESPLLFITNDYMDCMSVNEGVFEKIN